MTDEHEHAVLAKLLDRIRSGDADAAEQLMRQYEPELRRFVRYRMTSVQMRRFLESIDITQSVFAQFFTKIVNNQFEIEHPQQLFKLLTTMARNRLTDHARRQLASKRTPTGGGMQATLPVEDVADSAIGPSDTLAQSEIVEMVRGELSEEERDILDRRMSGQGWNEIAGAIGASPDSARKRLGRAIDRAAGKLELYTV